MNLLRTSITAVALSAFFLFSLGAQEKATAKPVVKSTPVAAKTTAAVKENGVDTLIVKARLIEVSGKFPPNDLYNYVYVMKYRVVSVEKGKYTEQDILVGHYNPLLPRKGIKDKMAKFVAGDVEKFEVGAKHRLVLVTPISKVWNDAVEDEYVDSDAPKYYSVKADVLK